MFINPNITLFGTKCLNINIYLCESVLRLTTGAFSRYLQLGEFWHRKFSYRSHTRCEALTELKAFKALEMHVSNIIIIQYLTCCRQKLIATSDLLQYAITVWMCVYMCAHTFLECVTLFVQSWEGWVCVSVIKPINWMIKKNKKTTTLEPGFLGHLEVFVPLSDSCPEVNWLSRLGFLMGKQSVITDILPISVSCWAGVQNVK